MMLIEIARDYAYQMHKDQVRKGKDTPFINHVEEAVEIAKTLTDNEVIIAATYLHDVVEDTPATLDDVRKLCGGEVAHYVDLETEDKRDHLDSKATWRIRKEEQLINLKNHDDKNLYIIVLSDKLANTNEMVLDYLQVQNHLWDRFNASYQDLKWYYESMRDVIKTQLDETEAFKKLEKNIEFLFYD